MSPRDWLDLVLIFVGIFSPTGAFVVLMRLGGQRRLDAAQEHEITERINKSQEERETAKWTAWEREREADRRIAEERFERLIALEGWADEVLVWQRIVKQLLDANSVAAPTAPPIPMPRPRARPGEHLPPPAPT
jgi:hypothetical protein